MTRLIILSVSLFCLLFTSCQEEKMAKPKLNEDQFTNMLIDIHVADGALDRKNIYQIGDIYKPSYYYNSIFKKYDITANEFDSCVFYYSNNVERFTAIYDNILDSLNRLETKLRIELKETKLACDTVNLWTREKSFRFSEKLKQNTTFSIPVNQKGIYTIRAKYRVFEDDQTETPKLIAYFWKKDTTGGPQKVYFDELVIEKDTTFKEYMIQLEFPDSTYTELRGNLFKFNDGVANLVHDFEIKDILIFNPQIKADTSSMFKDTKEKIDLEERAIDL